MADVDTSEGLMEAPSRSETLEVWYGAVRELHRVAHLAIEAYDSDVETRLLEQALLWAKLVDALGRTPTS